MTHRTAPVPPRPPSPRAHIPLGVTETRLDRLEDCETRFVECLWSEETPDACMMCSGEACALCGAGCWNNAISAGLEPPCEHDVTERHQEIIRTGQRTCQAYAEERHNAEIP